MFDTTQRFSGISKRIFFSRLNTMKNKLHFHDYHHYYGPLRQLMGRVSAQQTGSKKPALSLSAGF